MHNSKISENLLFSKCEKTLGDPQKNIIIVAASIDIVFHDEVFKVRTVAKE